MKTITLILGLLIGVSLTAQDKQTKYYENGQVRMEMVKVGDRLFQTVFYETGELKQVGTFVDNKPNGLWKVFAKNGDVLAEGSYENGLKTGKWIVKAENSDTTYELYYEEGVRIEAIALK